MRKQLFFFRFLILAVILIATAIFIEKKSLQPTNELVDVEKFSHTLFEKEKKIDTLLNSMYGRIKPYAKKSNINLFEQLIDINFNSLKQDGFVLLIYLNDSLKFWSDNTIEVDQLFSKAELNNTVLNLNNAWFYVRSKHDKNLEIVGLVKLRNDFSYQNEYLENTFQKDFELPPSIEVSVIPLSYSYDIYNKEDTYLFSLVPTNTISKSEDWEYLAILYFLGIAFLFLFLNSWLRQVTIQQSGSVAIIVFILAFLVFTRYLMLEFKYPLQIYSLPFFEPGYFAVSYLFPSLGDFLINSFLILLYTRSLFYLFRPGKLIRYFKKKPKLFKYFFSLGILVLVILYFNYVIQLLESLVINSSLPLEAHKVLELNLFSLLAYIIFGILFSALIIAVDRSVFMLKQLLKTNQFLILSGIVLITYSATVFFFEMNLSSGSIVYFLALFITVSYIYLKRRKYNYSLYIILIIIGSVYITLFVNQTIKEKDLSKANVLITKLINERDRVAELLLIGIEERLKSDDKLKEKIISQNENQLDEINNFLKKDYFGGYFAKYELDFVICCDCDNYEESKKLQNCANYYSKILDEYGNKITNTNFYYLDNHNGRVSYQGSVIFEDNANQLYTLYMTLDSKLITQEIGYPDLLIEGKENKSNPLSGYSYAKYQNGNLVTRSGSFPYDLNDKMFKQDTSQLSILVTKDYEHYIKEMNNGLIVLTKAKVKSFDLIIAFSYIFVFFNLLLLVTLATNNLTSLWHQARLNFENKLLLAMLFVLILSFAMVAVGTVYYNSSQFEQKHNTNISEKLESVHKNLEMEGYKGLLTDSALSNSNTLNISELLKKLSNIYYTDINLYDHEGKLIASSRHEIFDRGLIGSLMEPEAYRQMNINEKIRFIQSEKIGELQYSSAYALLKNTDLREPVFINLPYFTKPSELRKEVSNIVVAIINLYVVLFIVVAFISFFMANKVTQPLRMLQSKFQKIELGKQSEQIVYDKKDEVGALVEEYNRMVIKLGESIELLAKTERESAWREMAKQIAHEIKNPLTPMKLSVQFLMRAWQNKDEGFEKKLNKSTQTLIDQIDTLSNIATSFSNFAKMPKPKKELVDLVVRVEHTIELFATAENVTIETNIEKFNKLIIVADHEHISRVLTNLTKNAIQAIPGDREGHIKILAENHSNKVLLKVIDNGSGIADQQKEKLFTPNFTTKSSGMGMGLPIVKDIIESADGKIWFETELDKGTTFFIEFPLADEKNLTGLATKNN